jgi:hypothetical protein
LSKSSHRLELGKSLLALLLFRYVYGAAALVGLVAEEVLVLLEAVVEAAEQGTAKFLLRLV